MLRQVARIANPACLRQSFSHTGHQWGRTARIFSHLREYTTHEGDTKATKVEKLLLDGIKATGPIPFSTYMNLCLSHPVHGYYMSSSNAVFGSKGDFITSPEISQVFGELVGIWLISQWLNAGSPSGIRLVELGPGRGTLMEDILRAFSQLSATKGQLKRVHLIETSQTLREVQRTKLGPIATNLGFELDWHDHMDEIPSSPDLYTLLVAHEFFDALPFHLLQLLFTPTERPTRLA
ncbi:hypothetical protein AX16_007328 [Volvariella volvacea WC 439]|nr:hypothetical protein AX16_007328 [Volvariella volvacea WC 439]